MTRRDVSAGARDAFAEAVDWFPKGNCYGMHGAFTEATHEEQLEVCYGHNAPWAKRCPMLTACRDDVLVRAEVFGIAEITAGDLVAGGMTPKEQRALIRTVARRKNQ